jgi:hypothetical protein
MASQGCGWSKGDSSNTCKWLLFIVSYQKRKQKHEGVFACLNNRLIVSVHACIGPSTIFFAKLAADL